MFTKHKLIQPQNHISCVSYHKVERYIHKLKLGCAFGPDGIKAEHLKYALDIFILHLHVTNSWQLDGETGFTDHIVGQDVRRLASGVTDHMLSS